VLSDRPIYIYKEWVRYRVQRRALTLPILNLPVLLPESSFNPLKLKLVRIIFKYSVLTAKKTLLFTITKINWLTLFKEIIAVCTENHTRPINTKCTVTDCLRMWYIELPLGFKVLK
jgi:hypothetical protein